MKVAFLNTLGFIVILFKILTADLERCFNMDLIQNVF